MSSTSVISILIEMHKVFFLKILFIYSWKIQKEHRQREKQAPFQEPNRGLDLGSPGSCPGLKAELNHWATRAAHAQSIFKAPRDYLFDDWRQAPRGVEHCPFFLTRREENSHLMGVQYTPDKEWRERKGKRVEGRGREGNEQQELFKPNLKMDLLEPTFPLKGYCFPPQSSRITPNPPKN